jgi:hypothetical protein
MQQSSAPPAPTWGDQRSGLPHMHQSTAPPAPAWGDHHSNLPRMHQSTAPPAPTWGDQHSSLPHMQQSAAPPAPTWANHGGVNPNETSYDAQEYEVQGAQQYSMNRGEPPAMQPNSLDPWSTNAGAMLQNGGAPPAVHNLPPIQLPPWPSNGAAIHQDPGAASFQGISTGQALTYHPQMQPMQGFPDSNQQQQQQPQPHYRR